MLEPGQLSPRDIKKKKKIFWNKIGSRLFDEKKKFENSLSKAISSNRTKNFKDFSGIKNNDEFIFKFLKNQIIESINYSKKL